MNPSNDYTNPRIHGLYMAKTTFWKNYFLDQIKSGSFPDEEIEQARLHQLQMKNQHLKVYYWITISARKGVHPPDLVHDVRHWVLTRKWACSNYAFVIETTENDTVNIHMLLPNNGRKQQVLNSLFHMLEGGQYVLATNFIDIETITAQDYAVRFRYMMKTDTADIDREKDRQLNHAFRAKYSLQNLYCSAGLEHQLDIKGCSSF